MKSNIMKKGWSALLAITLGTTAFAGVIIAAPEAKAEGPISLTNRNDWIEYDHYHTAIYNPHNGMADVKTHPTFIYNEGNNSYWNTAGYLPVNDIQTIIDTVLTEKKYNNNALALAQFGRHIYDYTDSTGKESLYFLGYGQNPKVDFTIYPETYTKMKAVSFEIDASKANPHTLNGFGVMFNTGATNETSVNADGTGRMLNGNMLYFTNTSETVLTGQVYISPLTNINADQWHSTLRTGANNTYNLTVPSGSTTLTTSAYTLADSDKILVNMEVKKDTVKVNIVQKKANGTEAVLVDRSVTVPNITDFSGLGPVVSHKGHDCARLTYVQFGNLVISKGYTVKFYKNDGTSEQYLVVSEIEEGNSGMGGKFPKGDIPTRDDYAFLGWSTDPNATTPGFDENTPVTANTDVYAVWVPVSVAVKYPNTAWQKDQTTMEVIVTSGGDIQTATIKWNDSSPNTTVSLSRQSNGTYTGSVVVPKNKTGVVSADIPVGDGKLTTKTADADITWVDTKNPMISNIPNVSGENNIITAESLVGPKNKVEFADPDEDYSAVPKSSGIKESSRTLLLYKVDASGNVDNSAPTKEISWDQISSQWSSIAPGRYFYDIKVEDNVGHVTYASSTYTSASPNEGTDKGQPREDGSPGDLIGGGNPGTTPGGEEEGVVINATNPIVTIEHDGPKSDPSNPWYTGDVKVTVEGNQSTLPLVELQTENNGGTEGAGNKPAIDPKGDPTITNDFILTEDGTYVISGTTKDTAGLDASGGPVTIQIDRTKPEVTIKPDGSGDLSQITFETEDNPPAGKNVDTSGTDDPTFTVTIKDKNDPSKPPYIYTGDPGGFESWVDTNVPTGEYTVENAKITDKAGNESDPKDAGSTELWHEKPGDNALFTIDAKKKLQPTISTDGNYTSTAVDVINMTIDSKLPVNSVTVGGVNIPVTAVSKTGEYYRYTFPAPYTAVGNGNVEIVVDTIGATNGTHTVPIVEVDKLYPTINMPAAGMKLTDIPVSHWAGACSDPSDAMYVASGVNDASITYTITGTGAGETVAGSDWATLVNQTTGWGMAGSVTVTVSVSDNVGNTTTSTDTYTRSGGSTGGGSIGDWDVTVTGGENALINVTSNKAITFILPGTHSAIEVKINGITATLGTDYTTAIRLTRCTFTPKVAGAYEVTFKENGGNYKTFTFSVV